MLNILLYNLAYLFCPPEKPETSFIVRYSRCNKFDTISLQLIFKAEIVAEKQHILVKFHVPTSLQVELLLNFQGSISLIKPMFYWNANIVKKLVNFS